MTLLSDIDKTLKRSRLGELGKLLKLADKKDETVKKESEKKK